jgi:polyisoprenoid-binding protein YceI
MSVTIRRIRGLWTPTAKFPYRSGESYCICASSGTGDTDRGVCRTGMALSDMRFREGPMKEGHWMKKRTLGMFLAGVMASVGAAAAVWQIAPAGSGVPGTLAATASPAAAPGPAGSANVPAGAQRFTIDPQASEASYHVGETFFENNEFKVAVGVTHGIQGDVYVNRAHPDLSRIGPITVNVQQFTSDSRRRDDAIRRRWLESDRYPEAVFTPSSVDGLPKTYVAGQAVPVRVTGALKVHEVTKPVVFTGTLRLTSGVLTGNLETTVLVTDFGFDPPSIMMLKTENKATLDFQFTARPAAE